MLDARTINALQGLPWTDKMLALNTELVAPPRPNKYQSRGKSYVERLLLQLEERKKGQAELVRSAEEKALSMGRELATLESEDFNEAKDALDRAAEDGDKRLQDTFKMHRIARKGMKRTMKQAIARFPDHKQEILMVFNQVEQLSLELLDALVDYNAAVKSFAARFDPDAARGEIFTDAASLEKHLRSI